MTHQWWRVALLSCGMISCLAGCGSRDGLIEIRGEVTYDGRTVEKGMIAFMPADGLGPTAAAVIKDGQYAMKTRPGTKLVRIEGFKVIGQQHYQGNPSNPLVDIQEPIIPERYNAKSELTREITPAVSTYDFSLPGSSLRQR